LIDTSDATLAGAASLADDSDINRRGIPNEFEVVGNFLHPASAERGYASFHRIAAQRSVGHKKAVSRRVESSQVLA
jgi:hypothetical protein